MSRDQKLELLRNVPLFQGLSRRQLERLGQLTDEVELPEGRVLMRQGERGSEMAIIVEGTAHAERDGRLLAECSVGQVFGEMALLSEGPRVATVTLTSPSRVLVINHRDFHAMMDEIPDVRVRLLETLAERLRDLDHGPSA